MASATPERDERSADEARETETETEREREKEAEAEDEDVAAQLPPAGPGAVPRLSWSSSSAPPLLHFAGLSGVRAADLDRMDGIYGDSDYGAAGSGSGCSRGAGNGGAAAGRATTSLDVEISYTDSSDIDSDDSDIQRMLHFQDVFVPVPAANFAARLGLNETELTRALLDGEFEQAENIIAERADPEYFNDGVHSATPLNLALGGRASYAGNPRHLKIARMLVRKGANVNLRIPHHDLETASESPLELLVALYLSLLRLFTPGMP